MMERVLTELGLGGVKGVHEYYQSRVVRYIRILQKRCHELNEHYAKLLIPKCVLPIDSTNRYVKSNASYFQFKQLKEQSSHIFTGLILSYIYIL